MDRQWNEKEERDGANRKLIKQMKEFREEAQEKRRVWRKRED
jgi:hypothetical protein